MLETQEIERFYSELQTDINAELVSEEEGATPEQIFTETALRLLDQAGETENFRLCYDEKTNKRGVEHKINGYALYENYETLDLFVTIYGGADKIAVIQKSEIDKAFTRATKFLENAILKGYSNQIAESSEVFDLVNTLSNSPEVKEYLSRINIFLLTDGEVKSNIDLAKNFSEYKLFFRIIDIHYL
jgi:sugar-specific transcriptional regulator TrmB